MLRITHRKARWSSQIQTYFVTSQDYQLVSQQLRSTIDLDPSVLATTSTLTLATLAIPSHNSRDTILSYNSRNTTCLIPYPEPQLKGYILSSTQGKPAIPPLKHHQKPCSSRLQEPQPKVAVAKSPGGTHVLPGAASFHISWRETRAARRQTHIAFDSSSLQAPPGGKALTARRTRSSSSLLESYCLAD
ncbi:hypothetical protein DEO72_LG8g1600 [Vigna unguiculata]|uniref:Uncharacterized protein n=1 Tax=Vigna unguiculata TaxID=3917 RepID=A0A4D6MUI8_VIGUN|nr:hypothetical protein DEO72_LG8g1600 [Vigna unguiculata]